MNAKQQAAQVKRDRKSKKRLASLAVVNPDRVYSKDWQDKRSKKVKAELKAIKADEVQDELVVLYHQYKDDNTSLPSNMVKAYQQTSGSASRKARAALSAEVNAEKRAERTLENEEYLAYNYQVDLQRWKFQSDMAFNVASKIAINKVSRRMMKIGDKKAGKLVAEEAEKIAKSQRLNRREAAGTLPVPNSRIKPVKGDKPYADIGHSKKEHRQAQSKADKSKRTSYGPPKSWHLKRIGELTARIKAGDESAWLHDRITAICKEAA